ncbi:GNVR domain-containing protein [Candidatus Omnitrophota bacterium]
MNTLFDEQPLEERKPLDYIKIVFRRKWFLIIPLVLGILGGVIAGNTMPKIYRSSTLILVEEGRIINPLIKGLAVSSSTAQRLAILREQILGWDRINQLITKLSLASDVKNQKHFEDLVKELRNKIKVNLRGPSIVSISYDGPDPEKAKNIVQTITDIFIAENLRQQNQETGAAISFINDQLALYQKKLKQSEIANMREDLTKLLVDSTEKHPMVIDLRKKIAAAEGDLEKGDYTVKNETALTDSEAELKDLKAELKEMRKGLATATIDAQDSGANRAKMSTATNEKLYKLLLLERINKVSARDAGVNQKLYNTLLERLETAKITQSLEASKEGTRYTILDPARLPLEPIKPNKFLLLLVGAFMGTCLGGGAVFSVEMLDHSFLGVDQAKKFLDLPIFGAIPKIITADDLKAVRLRRAKITGFTIAGGVILLIIIIFNFLVSF